MNTDGIKESLTELKEHTNAQLPGLPYLGFAFWFAWNLIAFSGSIWLTQKDSGGAIIYLFMVHLVASVITLLAVNRAMRRYSDYILSGKFLAIGAVLGCLGTALMILEGGTDRHFVLFIIGCALAGIGTSFMLVRSGMILGLIPPRRSFKTISLCALFAIAVYFIVEGYSLFIGATLFILLPALSSICLAVRTNLPDERNTMTAVTKLPKRFSNLLLAIFVYSLSQAIVKSYLLGNLPASQWVLCMSYVMLALIVLMLVFVGINLFLPASASFGRIFYPLAILFVLPQLVISFLADYPIIAAAGIDFAGYAFDLFVWSMCAYLAFQMEGNSVKVFCYCTASLSAGLSIGSALAVALSALSPSAMQFYILNCLMAAASLVVTVFVFPESRLHDLFLPVDDEADDKPMDLEARREEARKSAFRKACDAVIEEGGLSKREGEVFVLLAKGYTAQQIAETLFISVHTARAHIRKIHSKLSVTSRKEIMERIESHIEEVKA